MAPVSVPSTRRTPWAGAAWRERGTLLTAAVLAAVAAAAWAALVLPSAEPTMGEMAEPASAPSMATLDPGQAGTFLLAWLVMMTAMMLPSAMPMIIVARATATGSALQRAAYTAAFSFGYLLVWGAVGVVVYLAQQGALGLANSVPVVREAWPWVVALVVAGAGVYQLSPLKDVCLAQCRSPFSFILTRWRAGIGGGLELGVRHGAYCLGCCWALMVVLVVAGAMGLAWVALIAFVIFVEKLLPGGRRAAHLTGAGLLVLAAAIAVRPEVVARLPM